MPTRPSLAVLLCVAASGLLLACGGDGGTGPAAGTRGIRIVAGAGTSDTVDADPAQALVVEVRRASGALATGVTVEFTPGITTGPSGRVVTMFTCTVESAFCPTPFTTSSVVTDGNGRARVRLRFGRLPGPSVIRIAVPELQFVDSALYTVRAGAPDSLALPATDTAIVIGESALLRARVTDRVGNVLTDAAGLSGGGGAATVDSARNTVTGVAFGQQWLVYRSGSLRDSMQLRVLPDARIVAWSTTGNDISLLDLTGRIRRVLAQSIGSSSGTFPQFDATRQRITLHRSTLSSFDQSNAVTVIDTASGDRREILPQAGFSSVESTRALSDGTLLVAGRRTGAPPVASGDGIGVFRVLPDNTITQVAALPMQSTIQGSVHLSHDGTRVAYTAAVPNGRGEIRIMTIATGASQTVAPDGSYAPRFSRDGAQLAYLSFAQTQLLATEGTVVIVNTDGSNRRVVSTNTYLPSCAWSPDAVYVICRESTPRIGLRVIRVSDGASVPLRYSPVPFIDGYVQPDWR